MVSVVVSGTGLWTPSQIITNAELVESYNAYASGLEGAAPSSVEFIEKASGIQRRYVVDKQGVLDPQRMKPRIEERPDEQLSLQAEICVAAARQALEQAGREISEVDGIIVGCSNLQRAYPAVSVEVQHALGSTRGWAYDMNVACSSATFALTNAVQAIQSGMAERILVISPEITSAHLNFRDRDSHFIFGDACTAVLVEAQAQTRDGWGSVWEVLGCRLATQFSNNIRNNFGFLNRCHEENTDLPDKLFRQNGRAVFKEVVPLVARHLQTHLELLGGPTVRRFWLHQANRHMNDFIAKMVLGHEPSLDEAPVILDEFANTSSAGSIIAFHRHRDDLAPGEVGVICSFGAGYSVGSVVLRRLSA